MRSVRIVALSLVGLVAAVSPSHAQTQPVGVVTTLTGHADVTRATLSQPLVLKFKDDVFERDRIATAEKSIVRVLLGGKAIVTVRELSVLTITEEPGRATIDLTSGKIAVAVAKQRMRPGESLDVRTPNAVAAVRGTVFAVEVQQVGTSQAGGSGPAGSTTTIIDVKPPLNPGDPLSIVQVTAGGQTRDVPGGSGINAVGNTLGQVRAWNPSALTAGLTIQPGSGGPKPDASTEGSIAKGTEQATFLSTAVLGAPVLPIVATPPPPSTTPPVNVLCQGGHDCQLESPAIVQQPPPSVPPVTPVPPVNPPPPPPPGDFGLIVNGGFETGDFTGWTRGGNLGFTSVTTEFFAHSGTFGASLGPIGSDGLLSQTFQTVARKPYIVTFSLRSDGLLPNDFSATWAGTAFFSQNNMPASGYQTFSFTEPGTGSATTLQFAFRDDPGFLGLDDVSVFSDPPLYSLGSRDTLVRTTSDPLVRYTDTPQTFDSLLFAYDGAKVSLAGPLLQAINSDLTVPYSLVTVMQGGSLVSTTTEPLVQLVGGTHSLGTMGLPIFDLKGVNTTTDAETGLTVGSDRPLQTAGALLAAVGATVNAQQVVRIDSALLEATAPLLALTGSTFNTARDAIQLSYQAKVTSLGSLAKLDASTLTVARGAALNVAGGSVMNVVGDAFTLLNGSSLRLLNGPLVSLGSGSVLNINGALLAFGGTGGNTVSIANSLCPCTTIGGLPVSLTGGALASNVSITNAVRNANLGSVNVAPNAAVLRVEGASTRVTINGM